MIAVRYKMVILSDIIPLYVMRGFGYNTILTSVTLFLWLAQFPIHLKYIYFLALHGRFLN